MLYSHNTLFICIYNTLTYKWFTNCFAFFAEEKWDVLCKVNSLSLTYCVFFFYLNIYHINIFVVFCMYIHILCSFEWMLWIIPLGWSRNLDLKKVSCYHWHVFTWFRMECPTHIILWYFIFHVLNLNDKIGEWHCYSWNVNLKYASCCIHWSEKDLTDDQHCYLRKAFSKHFWYFHRILAGWELSIIAGTSKEGHELYKYDLEYILNCFGLNASTCRVIHCGFLPSLYIHC